MFDHDLDTLKCLTTKCLKVNISSNRTCISTHFNMPQALQASSFSTNPQKQIQNYHRIREFASMIRNRKLWLNRVKTICKYSPQIWSWKSWEHYCRNEYHESSWFSDTGKTSHRLSHVTAILHLFSVVDTRRSGSPMLVAPSSHGPAQCTVGTGKHLVVALSPNMTKWRVWKNDHLFSHGSFIKTYCRVSKNMC